MTAIIGGVEAEPNFQGKPKHPIRDVLTWLCGKRAPDYVQGYDYSNLTDEQHAELQQWVCWNLDKTKIPWSTGIGLIEAAQRIVEEAVGNGNIPDKDSKWRTEGTPARLYEQRKQRSRLKKKKAARGFSLVELVVVLFFLGLIGVGVVYGIYRLIAGRPASDTAPMVQSWATKSGYTWQNSTCNVLSIVARCTAKVKELNYPVSLDCNLASEQCSLTPMARQ